MVMPGQPKLGWQNRTYRHDSGHRTRRNPFSTRVHRTANEIRHVVTRLTDKDGHFDGPLTA
jgi:hypothetical protein